MIADIDWSPDNTRIVVVGEGQPPAKVATAQPRDLRPSRPHPGRGEGPRDGAVPVLRSVGAPCMCIAHEVVCDTDHLPAPAHAPAPTTHTYTCTCTHQVLMWDYPSPAPSPQP